MDISRRESIKLAGSAALYAIAGHASEAQNISTDKLPPRIPLDEFVKDPELMAALVRGVRRMKARKPSDPLSWFYQAAIHGVPEEMVKVAAIGDPLVNTVEQNKYWNQCPHGQEGASGQESANFLPWHRAYTHYFERILRAHTGEPRFALPYWDYSKPENYKFPREFGTSKLAVPVDNDDDNPLWHDDRNVYFCSWEHWSGNNLPYAQLTPEAVDWSQARDSTVFFGLTDTEGLAGAVSDQDPSTRGRLESFPHDPIHRLTGVLVPPQSIEDPDHPGQVIVKDGYSLGMSGPPTAGFDPIFCVHHSNIDRLWAEWSCMPGKSWGNFPPQAWFDEKPWHFFDVAGDQDNLQAVAVNKPRKDYFDYRAMGTTFKYEDLSKMPLVLPDPIPASPPIPATPAPQLLATIASPMQVSGLRAERVSTAPAISILKQAFSATRTFAGPATPQRLLMRINGVNLGAINATGFDVHLTATPDVSPNRRDSSFLGSIALFRHEGHQHGGHVHDHGQAPPPMKKAYDTFDITKALASAGESDPTKMYVIIVPYSLSATVSGQQPIRETTKLSFDNIEFFSQG